MIAIGKHKELDMAVGGCQLVPPLFDRIEAHRLKALFEMIGWKHIDLDLCGNTQHAERDALGFKQIRRFIG